MRTTDPPSLPSHSPLNPKVSHTLASLTALGTPCMRKARAKPPLILRPWKSLPPHVLGEMVIEVGVSSAAEYVLRSR